MNSISDIYHAWRDKPEVHKLINDTLTDKVNADPQLKEYRDWIESNIFGFGERSFLWMWKLLVDEMPHDFKFLEIGVFRGQVLGLIRLLSKYKWPSIVGVTPLDSTDGHWESDYASDIKRLHETFKLEQPTIKKGLSTDAQIIEDVRRMYPGYDMVYIDGGHTYEVAKADIINYAPLVKPGGYLIVDDCAHKYKLPEGFFPGIASVSKAVDELLPGTEFTELFNVMHNRVFKKLSR